MAPEITVKAKIMAELEKSGMSKELEKLRSDMNVGLLQQFTNTIKAADVLAKRAMDDSSMKQAIQMKQQAQQQLFDLSEGAYGRNHKKAEEPPQEEKKGGMLSGLLGVGKGLESLLGFVSKISLGVMFATELIKVFEVPLKILQSGISLIADMFRPVADMLTVLMMPILVIVRPILNAVNALMMPFRSIAMQGMAAANQLLGKGMQELLKGNTATGTELIGSGLSGTLSSVSLLMSGIVQVIMKPFESLPLGIGSAIKSMLDGWESLALGGIMKVKEKADIISQINLDNIDAPTIMHLFEIVENNVDTLREKVGLFTVTNFTENMDIVKKDLKDTAEVFVNAVNSGNGKDMKTAVDTIDTQIIGLGDDSTTASTNLKTLRDDIINLANIKMEKGKGSAADMLWMIDDAANAKATPVKQFGEDYGTGMTGWRKDIYSFVWGSEANANKMKDLFAGISGSITNFGNNIKEGDIQNALKKGLSDMKIVMDDYFGHSLIPDSMSKGLHDMLLMTNSAFSINNDTSIVANVDKGMKQTNNAFVKGFNEIQNSSNEFVTSMTQIANRVNSLANAMNSSANTLAKAQAQIDSINRRSKSYF